MQLTLFRHKSLEQPGGWWVSGGEKEAGRARGARRAHASRGAARARSIRAKPRGAKLCFAARLPFCSRSPLQAELAAQKPNGNKARAEDPEDPTASHDALTSSSCIWRGVKQRHVTWPAASSVTASAPNSQVPSSARQARRDALQVLSWPALGAKISC